jgi:hypothetical protein
MDEQAFFILRFDLIIIPPFQFVCSVISVVKKFFGIKASSEAILPYLSFGVILVIPHSAFPP